MAHPEKTTHSKPTYATINPISSQIAVTVGGYAHVPSGQGQTDLRSPAGTAFRDMVSISTITLDGGTSVSLDRGYAKGKPYYWLQAPDIGMTAAMQLRWFSHSAGWHYCTTDIRGGYSGIGELVQIATLAVPAGVNGRAVSIQACAWMQGPQTAECDSLILA